MGSNHSILPKRAMSKQRVGGALSAAWARITANRKGEFADRLEISTGTVDNALTGKTVPEFHTGWNALLFDPTALDEVAKLYGVKITPLQRCAANDMQLAGELSGALTEFLTRLADGKRCHVDTAVIAELFRQLIPQMQVIVDEHDASKGVEVAA